MVGTHISFHVNHLVYQILFYLRVVQREWRSIFSIVNAPMITRKKKVLWESNHIAMSFLLIKYDLIIEVMPTSNTTFLNGTFVSFHWKFFFFFLCCGTSSKIVISRADKKTKKTHKFM